MRLNERQLRAVVRSIINETPLGGYSTVYRTPRESGTPRSLGADLEKDLEFMSQARELFGRTDDKWYIFVADNFQDLKTFRDETGGGLRDPGNKIVQDFLGKDVWESIPEDAYVLIVLRESDPANDDITAQYVAKHDFIGHVAEHNFRWDEVSRDLYAKGIERIANACSKAFKGKRSTNEYWIGKGLMKGIFFAMQEHGLNSYTSSESLSVHDDVMPDIFANFVLEPSMRQNLKNIIEDVTREVLRNETGLDNIKNYSVIDLDETGIHELEAAIESFSKNYAQNLHNYSLRWQSRLKRKGDVPGFNLVKYF